METDRLRQFCAVYETGSMTQASEVLGISLSGLSKSLQTLQEDLGFDLFQPDGRGVAVTDLGQQVYRQAREVLDKVAEMRGVQSATAASYKVGGMEVFTHSFLGQVIYEEFEDVLIEVSDLGAGDLERALLNKQIDVGVTYFPQPHDGIEFLKIKKIRLKAFVREKAVLQNYEDLRFVSPLSLDSPAVTDIFDQDGWPDYRLPRNHGLRTNRLSTALNLVYRSNYAVFMPEFLANELNEVHTKAHQLVELEASPGTGRVFRDVFLARRKGTPEGRLFKVLAKRIRRDL